MAAPRAGLNRVLAKNIDALLAAREEEGRRRTFADRISDAITRFTGSMRSVLIHALLYGLWILWNLGLLAGLRPFDPTFVVLAMVASVEALFLSTFVLISQNRMQAQAERRAELDLQISLLAEHEVTKLVKLLDAIAHQLGVDTGDDAELQDAKQDVDPSAVLAAISQRDVR